MDNEYSYYLILPSCFHKQNYGIMITTNKEPKKKQQLMNTFTYYLLHITITSIKRTTYLITINLNHHNLTLALKTMKWHYSHPHSMKASRPNTAPVSQYNWLTWQTATINNKLGKKKKKKDQIKFERAFRNNMNNFTLWICLYKNKIRNINNNGYHGVQHTVDNMYSYYLVVFTKQTKLRYNDYD